MVDWWISICNKITEAEKVISVQFKEQYYSQQPVNHCMSKATTENNESILSFAFVLFLVYFTFSLIE